MALGMTYDDYWYGDVLKARAFLKADEIAQKRLNDMAWLFGAYMCHAINATIGNVFRKEDAAPFEYPEKPVVVDIEEAKKKAEERKAKEQEAERLRLVAHLNQVMAAMQNKG